VLKASGERVAMANGKSGGGGGESAGVVNLSSEETIMNDARNCVQGNYWHTLDGPMLQLEFHGHYS
jgi:hypothetical protein